MITLFITTPFDDFRAFKLFDLIAQFVQKLLELGVIAC
jgi:hypothetical protein